MSKERNCPSDVLREFVNDLKAAYGTGDDLDREKLAGEWPDLLATYDQAVSCLSAPARWPEPDRGACWRCPDCGRTLSTADWTYADLADAGIPICRDCDVDMELIESKDQGGAAETRPVIMTVHGGVVQHVDGIPPGVHVVVRDDDIDPKDDPDYPRVGRGDPYSHCVWAGGEHDPSGPHHTSSDAPFVP